MSNITFILGQTATGKTALASKLAHERDGELVNCDSRQIYTHLDVVTGKSDNPLDIPTYMIDVVMPDQSYSAYEYAKGAKSAIETTVSKNKMPIVVGGTGMYAYMLMYADLSRQYQTSASPYSEYDSLTRDQLINKLRELDPLVLNKMNPSDRSNPRRILRMIKKLQGYVGEPIRPNSLHSLSHEHSISIEIYLHKNGDELNERIARRVDERIKSGAIEECKELITKGYTAQSPGMATIGYKSILRYLSEEIDQHTMREEWITRERQYAKRQKTYLLKYFPGAKVYFV